ncbi:30S ribosomal protein S12 methylthiotransferase RimO [Candidatus Reidiella endopervernicosa]|uniref:Ribosomal protein uS12 methylthiotransferase RimO n=1 Tax=Candidatus Reidiella endopervernicosa TaxID=2738883 RepID=A0A6N0HZ95_9GAMM|nr:30S ribosomal protein S12 methylthiotransferase RimO [Candidatus Reidiella endopervernicosa]QKQ27703.1 30S ribosomal protein S12 methylthiotransferase RimO [Candidatus Reidiella endopervernicosa]
MNNQGGKIGFVSLGCPKATVDSERILTRLRAEGYQLAPDYDEANLVIVNTCGFIDSAVQESLDAISEAMDENGKVIVTGCLGADEGRIREVQPDVLAVTGPQAFEEVMEAVHGQLPEHNPHIDLLPPQGIKLTPRHYAYLKISEGCNQSCSFCIIPSMRGKLVSRPINEVLDEAERLAGAGVKELLVVSQDSGAYGVDTKYQTSFWQGRPVKSRLTEMAKILGDMGMWIRLHYPYPHIDELLTLMADGTILPYLDAPLQHASPPILKAMRRPANSENALRRIEQWRRDCPDLTLRSTFIVGFPGETEEDFETLLDFIEEAGIDRAGAFTYSAVEGATANELPGAVPEELKLERLERLMERQEEISADRLAAKVGRKMRVLVDDIEGDLAIARSGGDAPEVDGVVIINDGGELPVGEFVEVEIDASDAHDLWAHRIER